MKFIIEKMFNIFNIKFFQFLYFYKRTLIYRKFLKKIPRYSTTEELYEKFIDKNNEIQFIEFGVFKGRSLKIISKLNSNPNSKFFGFDSFNGLPDDWSYGILGGKKEGHFKLDDKNILNFDDNRITIIDGYFNKTLKKSLNLLSKKKYTLVHFDADLYSSTLYCLTMLHNHFESYVVIFDEFPMHECSALHDYASSYNVDIKFLACTVNDVRVACKIECK